MRLEALGPRHGASRAAQSIQSFISQLLDEKSLLKRSNGDAAVRPRLTKGRQHMIGARAVVTNCFGSEWAEEDRSCIPNIPKPVLWIFGLNTQMFRGIV